jgi:hypothetical protein
MMAKGFKYTAIIHLNLSHNPIKNKGAKCIGEMIMRGSDIKLEELTISDCQITH